MPTTADVDADADEAAETTTTTTSDVEETRMQDSPEIQMLTALTARQKATATTNASQRPRISTSASSATDMDTISQTAENQNEKEVDKTMLRKIPPKATTYLNRLLSASKQGQFESIQLRYIPILATTSNYLGYSIQPVQRQ